MNISNGGSKEGVSPKHRPNNRGYRYQHFFIVVAAISIILGVSSMEILLLALFLAAFALMPIRFFFSVSIFMNLISLLMRQRSALGLHSCSSYSSKKIDQPKRLIVPLMERKTKKKNPFLSAHRSVFICAAGRICLASIDAFDLSEMIRVINEQ